MFRLVSILAAFGLFAHAAIAQCDEWLPTPGDSSWIFNGSGASSVGIIRAIDHDGPGPLPPTLYAAYPLSRWTGLAWQVIPVLSSSNPVVKCMEPLNDGTGGLPPGRLLLGGSFVSADGTSRVVASWDGQTLSAIGPSTAADFSSNATVNAMATWDPDGPGPMTPWIIVGGSFTRLGGVNTTNIAAWDGTQWRALGTGLTQPIAALTAFDPDGDGPALPLLIAGGQGGTIKSWNGSSWQTMGAGFIGTTAVSSLAVFDPDADGPAPASLWVAGTFESSGATSLPGLARWSGTAWVSPGAGFSGFGAPYLMRVLDLDGPGPQLPKLVVGGLFGSTPSPPPTYLRTVAVFDGTTWTPLNGSPNSSTPTSAHVSSFEVFDPDGAGPRPMELIVAASSSNQIGWPAPIPYFNIGAWDGQRWMTLGNEFVGAVKCFQWLDEAGDGQTPPVLYAAGTFSAVGATLADSIARWDGTRWVGIGTPHGHSFRQLLTHDPDGPGGQAPWILAVESSNLGTPGLFKLEGGAWVSLSASTPTNGWSAASFDDDGTGPLPPNLFATFSGGLSRYNGVSWSSADTVGGHMWLFPHIDGVGQPPSLYSLVLNGSLRRWNGTAWTSISNVDLNNNSGISRAVSWDPDGPGPRTPEIVVASTTVNSYPFAESFDGQRWRWLSPNSGFGGDTAWTPATFDPDGDGPVAPQLFIGFGGSSQNLYRRLINDAWVSSNPGIRNNSPTSGDPTSWFVQAFATVDPDGDGPMPPELWIGGSFSHANGVLAQNWARLRYTAMPPALTQHPASAQACLNSQAVFTVGVASTNTPTYQWKIADPPLAQGWTPLSDGPLIIAGAQVATVSGALTPTLTVQASEAPFATDFRCMIVNTCGSVETVTAHLSITPCCGSADFNCDGDVGTDQDIDAFFACLSGLCPSLPCTNSADFNADGDVGTDQDIDAFFRVLAGGSC